VRTPGCALLAVVLVSCATGPDRELTHTKPYADLVQTEYTVIADDLYAYGIYDHLNSRDRVGSIALIPGVGIAGLEVAFRKHVPKGQVIRIVSAWRQFLLFDNGVYYLVTIEGSDLPRDIPIRLELFRGNEGVGAEPNPAVYAKRPTR
jgi:hypothetical protein